MYKRTKHREQYMLLNIKQTNNVRIQNVFIPIWLIAMTPAVAGEKKNAASPSLCLPQKLIRTILACTCFPLFYAAI